ncbi:hypothetical protein PIB30_107785, partial [Stylosanthes scabra]|nr:hypothetical protein [Stylosanthes scabra]
MATEGSGPGRNLSMEIDDMKDKMECMVELQSCMETMLKTMGDMLNIHLGAHRAQIINTDTTRYQPVDRVHTEVPAQVIDNATGSHAESGKDK